MPKWDTIIVSSLIQGAGHAAYLTKAEMLHGVVMIFGPQDECTNCTDETKYWANKGPDASTWAF